MIDPSEVTEDIIDTKTGKKKGLFTRFTEDDYLALMAKDSESLFQEVSYMKHLRRHSTRYCTMLYCTLVQCIIIICMAL